MKKMFSFFVLLIMLSALNFNVSAAKWRVNNIPGINANFSTLKDAYNGASAGDTIYLEGTGIPYIPPDTIKKKLIIIGPGYFLAENDSTQANKAPASIYSMTIGRGAAGTVITGLNITYILYITDVSNITIMRNFIANLYIWNYWANITNILIRQNYISGNLYQQSGSKTATQVQILNNYLNQIQFENPTSTSVVMNNSIYWAYYLYNSEFNNNIVSHPGASITAGSNNQIYNNIFAVSGTNYDGNKFGVSMTDVYAGMPNSTDGQYRLKPSSPAKGAGYAGVDCGAFGNNQPYVLSGIPALPHIFEARVENSGSSGTGLPVRIKAKSLK